MRSRKLNRSEMTELGLRTRFSVISNLVQKLSLVMQQPIAFSENQFRKHYDRWTYAPLPLLTNLAPEQVARFQENSGKTPALNLEIQPVRYYPYKTTAAHNRDAFSSSAMRPIHSMRASCPYVAFS